MEYTSLIHDFADRTLKNLDQIARQDQLGTPHVYPVTQLWNSLLGLVVAPREREIALIPEVRLDDAVTHGWPQLTTTFGAAPKTVGELFRNLRNSVAHFNVEFKAGLHGEITWVEMWNNAPRGGPAIWKARITVADLDSLARQLAKLYLDSFASAA